MIMGHIFKALIAVNCLEVSGNAEQKERQLGCLWKNEQGSLGSEGVSHSPSKGSGRAKYSPSLSGELEYQADTDSTVWVVCFTNTEWVTGSSHVQRSENECFSVEHSVCLAYSLVCICVSQKIKFRNDFTWY